jgi:predicted enzyme related to lactoylglutathione lyase
MTKVNGLLEVILYVEEMIPMVNFYRDVLGLPLTDPENVEELEEAYWVDFDAGGCTISLHKGGEQQQGQDAPTLIFGVDDVYAMRFELLSHGVEMDEIRFPATDVTVCDGVDPEGNRFSIESRGKEAKGV